MLRDVMSKNSYRSLAHWTSHFAHKISDLLDSSPQKDPPETGHNIYTTEHFTIRRLHPSDHKSHGRNDPSRLCQLRCVGFSACGGRLSRRSALVLQRLQLRSSPGRGPASSADPPRAASPATPCRSDRLHRPADRPTTDGRAELPPICRRAELPPSRAAAEPSCRRAELLSGLPAPPSNTVPVHYGRPTAGTVLFLQLSFDIQLTLTADK